MLSEKQVSALKHIGIILSVLGSIIAVYVFANDRANERCQTLLAKENYEKNRTIDSLSGEIERKNSLIAADSADKRTWLVQIQHSIGLTHMQMTFQLFC